MQANNITPQMLENEEVRTQIRENMLTASDNQDYTNLEPEQLVMFQSMIEKGIVEAKSVADIGYILKVGGLMLLVSFGATIITIIATYFSSNIAMGFGTKIREAIFTKVEAFSSGNMNKFGAASLVNRTTNDVNQIQTATVMILRMMIAAPIMCVRWGYNDNNKRCITFLDNSSSNTSAWNSNGSCYGKKHAII